MRRKARIVYEVVCHVPVMWVSGRGWMHIFDDEYPAAARENGASTHRTFFTKKQALRACRQLEMLAPKTEIFVLKITWPKGVRKILELAYYG